jgi:hypothetical protein
MDRVEGFEVDDEDKREHLLDTFCYGIALALGNSKVLNHTRANGVERGDFFVARTPVSIFESQIQCYNPGAALPPNAASSPCESPRDPVWRVS